MYWTGSPSRDSLRARTKEGEDNDSIRGHRAEPAHAGIGRRERAAAERAAVSRRRAPLDRDRLISHGGLERLAVDVWLARSGATGQQHATVESGATSGVGGPAAEPWTKRGGAQRPARRGACGA